MHYFLKLLLNFIPIISISFVIILLVYKIYITIRSKFNSTVNCWFCNNNTKVAFGERNGWNCPSCDQYNGFTKDGGYNRDIYEQYDCSNSKNNGFCQNDITNKESLFNTNNGLCGICNENQRVKVEKLSQFEPKKESKFDEELKIYKSKLEEQYRLCHTCERFLKKVLHEKKRMVLGAKFLDFIMRSAESIKGPHFNQLKIEQKQAWSNSIRFIISILMVVNVCFLLKEIPMPTKESINRIFHQSISHWLFICISHLVALGKVLFTYTEMITEFDIVQKVYLFFKTLLMMTSYSLGIKGQQVNSMEMTSFYFAVSSTFVIIMTILHNVLNSFKLTRYTFFLTTWSLYACGVIDQESYMSKELILFVLSSMTLISIMLAKDESKYFSQDTTSNSFHRIYTEDYEDTISLLSQQLNNSHNSCSPSNSSMNSYSSNNKSNSPIYMMKSPMTSSEINLNRTRVSPFKNFCADDNSVRSGFSPYTPNNRLLFASNVDVNRGRQHIFASPNSSFSGAVHPFANKSFNHDDQNHFNTKFGATPLGSPFSYSHNTVYQRSNLLTPSRFSTNSLASPQSAATSWLSGGYFNPPNPNPEKLTFFLDNNNIPSNNESLSRASSHSSGFESHASSTYQNGGRFSRENSFCPDLNHLATANDPIFKGYNNCFHPTNQTLTPLHPMASPTRALSQSSLNQMPLSIDCNQDYWKIPKTREPSVNRFNLNKINEELPRIQRGDLLKKWQEQQNTQL